MKRTWDRWAIAAEVKRRGSTLRALSNDAGLCDSACRQSLIFPSFPAAERAISGFLEVPLHELWPDRYFSDGTRRFKSNRKKQDSSKKTSSQCQMQEAA